MLSDGGVVAVHDDDVADSSYGSCVGRHSLLPVSLLLTSHGITPLLSVPLHVHLTVNYAVSVCDNCTDNMER